MKLLILAMVLMAGMAYAEPQPLPPVTGSGTYPAGTTKPAATNTLYELIGRLEQLQVEVQRLTGKVEEQTYQLNELKKRQNALISDYDERIQSLETKQSSGGQADTAAPAAAVADQDTKPAESSAAAPAPPPAAEKPAQAAEAKKSEPAAAPESEKQQYQQAYDSLRRGRTAQSITEFKAFLNQYPHSELAGNAQYWLGEAHKVNQDVNSARQAFNSVVDSYPGSPKVPDALLKLGYIEFDQQNWVKAREYLSRVSSQFPDSTAAHLAAKKLTQLDNAQH